MGKKGKRKKKKDGAAVTKSGGRRGKNQEMTFTQGFIAYQIFLKEQELENALFDVKNLEDQLERNKLRNEHLKEDQAALLHNLIREAREIDERAENEDKATSADVQEHLKVTWDMGRMEEKQLKDLRLAIRAVDKEIDDIERLVEYWADYKVAGSVSHGQQIKLLEQELVNSVDTYQRMCVTLSFPNIIRRSVLPRLSLEYHERMFNKDVDEIHQRTQQTVDSAKETASFKAVEGMDKYDKGEVLDHEYLLKEVQIHQQACDKVEKEVADIERKNVDIMAELFECKAEDIAICRSYQVAEIDDSRDMDAQTILEVDLSVMDVPHAGHRYFYQDVGTTTAEVDEEEVSLAEKAATKDTKAARPKSAAQKAVEDKLFAVSQRLEELEISESEPSRAIGDDEDFEDHIKVGPMELSLLHIAGREINILPGRQVTQEEIKSRNWRPEKWPITRGMLHTHLPKKPKKIHGASN